MITHRNLLYVLKIGELRSFRRAAESLNVTHSALVRSLKATEDDLGARLFDRGAGLKVAPTEIGAVFLEQAQEIYRRGCDLRQDIQSMLGLETGELNIAMGTYPCKISCNVAICRLLNHHPKLRVKSSVLHYPQVVEAVLERRVDLGIAEYSEATVIHELAIEPLGSHPVAFICRSGHPLAGLAGLSLTDLLSFPWCSTRFPRRASDFLPANPGKAGTIDPMTGDFIPRIQVNTVSEMAEMVAGSDMLSPAALCMFEEELRNGKLSFVSFRAPWMVTNYGFLSLKHRVLSPSTRAYMDEVRMIERDMLRKGQKIARSFPFERFSG